MFTLAQSIASCDAPIPPEASPWRLSSVCDTFAHSNTHTHTHTHTFTKCALARVPRGGGSTIFHSLNASSLAWSLTSCAGGVEPRRWLRLGKGRVSERTEGRQEAAIAVSVAPPPPEGRRQFLHAIVARYFCPRGSWKRALPTVLMPRTTTMWPAGFPFRHPAETVCKTLIFGWWSGREGLVMIRTSPENAGMQMASAGYPIGSRVALPPGSCCRWGRWRSRLCRSSRRRTETRRALKVCDQTASGRLITAQACCQVPVASPSSWQRNFVSNETFILFLTSYFTQRLFLHLAELGIMGREAPGRRWRRKCSAACAAATPTCRRCFGFGAPVWNGCRPRRVPMSKACACIPVRMNPKGVKGARSGTTF